MCGSRIWICHRNRLLSECLGGTLNHAGDLECHIVSSEKAMENSATFWESSPADLLLLDATLENDLAFRVAERMRSLNPSCQILLTIPVEAIGRMFELARIGSRGCLFEGCGVTEVRDAVRVVLGGQPFCSPQLASALVAQVGDSHSRRGWPEAADAIPLTSREREVLELIACQQLANKQIARQLGLSLYTVKNHVHNLIEKLGVVDRHEAVQLARRRGLLNVEWIDSAQPRAIRIPR